MVIETIGEGEQRDAVSDFVRAIESELVVPIVVLLASERCDVTHQCFSACAGRFARAFVGLAEGWMPEARDGPNAEDLVAHFDEIAATEPCTIPGSIFDEVAEIFTRLGIEG